MGRTTLASAIVLGLAIFTTATIAQSPPGADGYAWAEACKDCHSAQFQAWSRTKHSTALDRLSNSDQEKVCIGCHVTGPKTRVLDGKRVLNRGIQCEACHGPAAAHVADPNVRTGLVKSPPASTCEECHSDKGPHFKGFWYSAMRTLSHRG